MTTPEVRDPGYEVYERVATDVGGNVTYAFIGVGLIWLLSKPWPLVAKTIFWIGASVSALQVLHVLYVTILGIVAAVGGARMSKWIWGANAARVLECALLAVAVWLGARLLHYL